MQRVEADRGYINNGSVHKLIIGNDDTSAYNELASRGAIVDEIDYGSFKLIRVSEQAAGLAFIFRGRLQSHPDFQ